MFDRKRDRRIPLGLEGLEGRNLLSTVTVSPDGIQGAHIGYGAASVQPLDLNPQPLPPGYTHVEKQI